MSDWRQVTWACVANRHPRTREDIKQMVSLRPDCPPGDVGRGVKNALQVLRREGRIKNLDKAGGGPGWVRDDRAAEFVRLRNTVVEVHKLSFRALESGDHKPALLKILKMTNAVMREEDDRREVERS